MSVAGVVLNTSDSGPKGLGVKTAEPVETGSYVLLCPDPRQDWIKRYLWTGPCKSGTEPLLKVVVATAGDMVKLDGEGVTVNGKHLPNSAPHTTDMSGRPLPSLAYHGTIADGYIFVVNSYSPWSLDSRYFGPRPVTAVLSVAKPLLVAE